MRRSLPLLTALAACHARPAPPAFVPDADFRDGRLPAAVEQGTPRPGGEVRVRIWSEPTTLDPLLAPDGLAWKLVEGRIFETLVRFDDAAPAGETRYAPALATSWEVSKDGLTYTFHLRDGVRFHDGAPFTSADVVRALELVRSGRGSPALATFFAGVKSFAAPDPRTFVVTYAAPYAHALESFASTLLVARGTARAPIGTGPWRFVRWNPGESIVLARNDGYWGEKPHLDRVVYRVVKDDGVAWQLMEKGELDVVPRLTAAQYRALAEEPRLAARYHRVRSFGRDWSFLAWNCRRKDLADPRVRRALAELVDLDAFRDKVLGGLERPATCAYWSASPSCPSDLAPVRYDPARASAELAAAGKPKPVTLLYSAASPYFDELAAFVKEELGKGGVEVSLERVDWSVFLERARAHAFDALLLTWTATSPETDLFELFHSSQAAGGANYGGLADPELDALLVKARAEPDARARVPVEQAISRRLLALQPYLFVDERPELDAVSRRLRGERFGLGWWRFERAWLAEDGK